MDYSSFFNGYETEAKTLEEDGFSLTDSGYVKSFPLLEFGLECILCFDPSFCFSLKVMDLDADQEYFLYRLDSATGSFVGEVRLTIQTLLEEVRRRDFRPTKRSKGFSPQMEELFAYAKKEFGEDPDCPFSEDNTLVLRCASNRKWYALFMQIPLAKLGLYTDQVSWVMNVRFETIYLNTLPKDLAYPAYHMNKKSWISVPLDQDASNEDLIRLLKDSRERAAKQK